MKKTLISLAVVASAAASGSAMAWTANGTGGSVDMGGVLTPVAKVTPWEVQVGAAITGLDADIQKGQRTVDIAVNKPIPVLGIRTQLNTAFSGQPGIAPQIDYQGAVNVDNFSDSSVTLNIDVLDKTTSQKIGKLSSELFAGAIGNYKSPQKLSQYAMYAGQAGHIFFGGMAKTLAKLGATNTIGPRVQAVFPGVNAKYNNQGNSKWDSANYLEVEEPTYTYSAYYGSGIEAGKIINITLDTPVQGDTSLDWKASLPVTVYYQ